MTDGSSAPLLLLDSARIALADGSRLAPLDAVAHGTRVGLIGAWAPLFRLLGAELRLAAGRAEIAGSPASRAVASGVAGLARFDPVLAPAWTAERTLVESAALLGMNAARARSAARELLARFELTRIASRPLAALGSADRRALFVAHATLGEPRVVCCESPLARLEDPDQAYVEAALERAIAGRAAIVSVGSTPPLGRERAWLDSADHVIVLSHGHVVASGPPSDVLRPSARVLATVTRHADAFANELSARGVDARRVGHVQALLGLLVPNGAAEVERFVIELPAPRETRAIVEAAAAAQAPLVELSPVEALTFPDNAAHAGLQSSPAT